MTLNFPGPNQVRLFYTCNTHPHVQQLNCEEVSHPGVGYAIGNYDFATRAGGSVQADTAIDAWVALIKPMFSSTYTSFTHAEVWEYDPGTNDGHFLTVYSLGVSGTSGSGLITAGQAIMNFITQEGGNMRLDFMESTIAQGNTDPYPFPAGVIQDTANFVIGTSNWIKARDSSFPVAARNWLPGVNEAWTKRVYRGT